ncbi:ribosomal RNA large subunit methyltransferase H [Peptococcaceae bacterium CEB3]|nr:ribosomal RNA large subunit methyltransferase H [Peptococcaceae bacterium CEB3]
MNFSVYLLGGKIEGFYVDAIREYEKRLTRYCRIRQVPFISGEQLRSDLSPQVHKILISHNGGESLSSEKLADRINTLMFAGISETAFILSAPNLLPTLTGLIRNAPRIIPDQAEVSPFSPSAFSSSPVSSPASSSSPLSSPALSSSAVYPEYEILTLTPLDMDLGLQATLVYEQLYRAYRILNHEPYHK